MKLYIDYDKKNDDKKFYDEKNEGGSNSSLHNENSHKTDIVNIINAIVGTLPNITSISIMKSIPDTEKRSYHIIFEGMHFTKAKTIDTFMKEQIKPKFRELFDKKIIDTSVYDPKCFRTLLSTKCGQNRPLFLLDTKAFLTDLQEVVISAEETTYEQYLKTCITHIEADSILFNYKSEKKKDNSKKIHLMNDEDIYKIFNNSFKSIMKTASADPMN